MFLPQNQPDRYRKPIIEKILGKVKSSAERRYDEIVYGIRPLPAIPLWELLLMEEILHAKANNNDNLQSVAFNKIEYLFQIRLQKDL